MTSEGVCGIIPSSKTNHMLEELSGQQTAKNTCDVILKEIAILLSRDYLLLFKWWKHFLNDPIFVILICLFKNGLIQ